MVYLKLAERFVLFRHHSAPPLDSALHLFSIVLSQRKPVVRLTYVVYTSALHLLYYHTWASWTNDIWINILILPRRNRNFYVYMTDSWMNNMCTFWWSETLRWGGRPMWWRLQLNPSPVNRKSTIVKWRNRCFHSIKATVLGGSSIEECLRSILYLESSKAENKKCDWNNYYIFSKEDIIVENWNDD